MKWNENLSAEKKDQVLNACRGLTSEYLMEAFNEYCITNDMEPTLTAMDVVSRDRLVDLVYKMIFVTRVCDEEETIFFIVRSGRFLVNLNTSANE